MRLLERILVATDLSIAAEAVVLMASYVARRFDSRVDLLHVKTPAAGGVRPSSNLDQVLSERLDELARQMVKQGVRNVESVLLDGVEFDQIEQYAQQQDMNLIMMGAAEASSSRQFLPAATAARLRRRASKPVWIVKPGTGPPIRRILCPVDLLPASARALKNAIHFARIFEAELTVLTVTQWPLSDYGDLLDLPKAARAFSGPQGSYLPEFDEFLRGFDFHRVRFEKVIRQGKPRTEVVQVAREMQADLIVIGSVGRTGLSHLLMGGVARRVSQELPCSIITVRSQQPIRLSVERDVPPVDATLCASHRPGRHCERIGHGKELLAHGLIDEAVTHFLACVDEYELCNQAWEWLAKAYARLDQHEKAQWCEARAEEALRRLSNHQIEEELRGEYIPFRRIFGI